MTEDITCGRCSLTLPNRHIDWVGGKAYCQSCEFRFEIQPLKPDPARLLQRWATLVSREQTSKCDTWTVRWYAPLKLIGLAPVAVILPISVIAYFFLDQEPVSFLVVLALTFYFAGQALLTWLNSSSLKLDNQSLMVSHQPIPWPFGARTFNWSSIQNFRVIGVHRRFPGKRHQSYQVFVNTEEGATAVLVGLSDFQLACELAAVLEAGRQDAARSR